MIGPPLSLRVRFCCVYINSYYGISQVFLGIKILFVAMHKFFKMYLCNLVVLE